MTLNISKRDDILALLHLVEATLFRLVGSLDGDRLEEGLRTTLQLLDAAYPKNDVVVQKQQEIRELSKRYRQKKGCDHE